jgi:hypothetical protein
MNNWIETLPGLIFEYSGAALTPKSPPNRAFRHMVMVQTMKAFRIRKPHELGIYTGCACHPAANPAARDYRRRTRHRNRRRR